MAPCSVMKFPSCPSLGWVSLHQVFFTSKGKHREGNKEKVLSKLSIRGDMKLV